jgi:hypothetical protein
VRTYRLVSVRSDIGCRGKDPMSFSPARTVLCRGGVGPRSLAWLPADNDNATSRTLRCRWFVRGIGRNLGGQVLRPAVVVTGG